MREAPDGADAIEAVRRAFAAPPRWAAFLTDMRDRIVAPFGLTSAAKSPPSDGRLSTPHATAFPVISEAPDCVVMGLTHRGEGRGGRRGGDDHRAPSQPAGRLYLAAVPPFHRLIAPAFAARIC